MDPLVSRCPRAVALAESILRLERSIARPALVEAVRRGHFLPGEEEQLVAWFARFLTVREGLWQVIGEVAEPVGGDLGRITSDEHWRGFVLGYAAACLAVRLDRPMSETLAVDAVAVRRPPARAAGGARGAAATRGADHGPRTGAVLAASCRTAG